jgi:hypothetical protein
MEIRHAKYTRNGMKIIVLLKKFKIVLLLFNIITSRASPAKWILP